MKQKIYYVFSCLRSSNLTVIFLLALLLFYGIIASIAIMVQRQKLIAHSAELESKNVEIVNLQTNVEKYSTQYNDLLKEMEAQQIEYDAKIDNMTSALNEMNTYDPNLFLDNMNTESATLVDSRLDKDLVNMIINHFDALYSGDLKGYQATLKNPEYEYLTSKVKPSKTQAKVKIITTHIEDNSYFSEFNQKGGNFIVVEVLSSESEQDKLNKQLYYVGVTKDTGVWLVYDYD